MKCHHLTLIVSATLAATFLSGCSSSFAPSPVQPTQTPIGNIQGSVHGGQAPVSGGRIYLYAAGTGGYGTSATSLICNAGSSCPAGTPVDTNGNYYVLTDSNGNFSLGGDYTCTQGQQVYMVAVGGNPGLTPVPPATSVDNTAIVQMAGLGQCPATGNLAAQVPYLIINEVTTVAFAYSMSGFATNAYNVSSSGTTLAQAGLANAMLNAGNIVNLQYGAALAAANGNANGIVPQSKINALANILATCVNTSSPSSSQCLALFSLASVGGTPATDEANAIFNIVHHPTASVGTIFNLQPSSPVFQPYITSAPTDWTLPIVYQGVVGTPVNVAFDARGNAWIGDQVKGVVEIGPQGAVSTFHTNQNNGNQAFGTIYGVAVSPSGTIWAADYGRKYVYIMNSAGTVTTTITSGNLDGPAAVAFNQAGGGFVVNYSGVSVTPFDSSGNSIGAGSGSYPVGSMNHPNWIAVDTSGNAWITSRTNYIGELQYNSGSYTKAAYKLDPNLALAFDGSGTLWVAGDQTNDLYQVSPAGALQATWNGSGLNAPQSVAVDGAGNIWVGNGKAAVISGFSNTGASLNSGGLTTGSTGNTLAVTPDGSGNLWSANSDGTVSELLGASTPVATPMIPGSFGVRP